MALLSRAISSSAMPTSGKREMTIDEFKRWLKTFDSDRDGRISRDELRQAVQSSGGRFSRWKGRRGVRSADANGNGYIDDHEIHHLAEFAEKHLGIKIICF